MFLKREFLSRELQWGLRYRRASIAERFATHFFSQNAGRVGAMEVMAGACLRAARRAEAHVRFADACRLWLWHAMAGGDAAKAAKNMIRCARNTTKTREDENSIAEALEAWEYVLQLVPGSADARGGAVWCHDNLARRAEQAADFAAARRHWVAALEIQPGEASATEALKWLGERGSSTVSTSPSRKALKLYNRLKRSAGNRHDLLCAAGRLLLDAEAPKLAGEFLQRAFEQNAGAEVAILLYRSCIAVGDYKTAGRALLAAAKAGCIHDVPVDALPVFLRLSPVGDLPDPLLSSLTGIAMRDNATTRALLPHLLGRGLTTSIRAIVDGVQLDNGRWPAALVLETGRLLTEAGERGRALRFYGIFSQQPEVAFAFDELANCVPAAELERLLMAGAGSASGRYCPPALIVSVANALALCGNPKAAADVLCPVDLPSGTRRAEELYAACEGRVSEAISRILISPYATQQIRLQLAGLAVSLLPAQVREFFAGPALNGLVDRLMAASHREHAPSTSREGGLREGYFDHHMERRENCKRDSLDGNFGLCAAFLQYLEGMSKLSDEEGLVSASLQAELAKNCFSPDGRRWFDRLMSYAVLSERPDCDLRDPNLFEKIGTWYLQSFMPAYRIPASCISPDVQSHFSSAQRSHPAMGVVATPFAGEIWREISPGPEYQCDNALQVLLTGLSAVARLLPQNPHYRPLLSAMMPPAAGDEPSFVDLCIEVMQTARPGERPAIPFTVLLANRRDFGRSEGSRPALRAAPRGKTPSDVLLIGHGGEGTGLNRNFRMLQSALSGPDLALATLGYELPAEEFAAGLRTWRNSCRSRPIVIAAVNAQDIPALFVRDRHHALENCHIAGFFLWETSRAPQVQRLGIQLVDEIWAPTEYVASVYSPFAAVRVVGKGLYEPNSMEPRNVPDRDTVQFLTVFDFHSSIERKNPLACVLAFQRAFRSGEHARLVLKASNVNLQHPGNAFRQWERICDLARSDSRIRLITDRYDEAQMQRLLQSASCLVSLHRSEGFGYVLADAMAWGIPVIATNYSGNIDFCTHETGFPVNYHLVPVRSLGAHWEGEGAEWAEPDIDSAAARMMEVYSNYPAALARAAIGRSRIRERYSVESFAARVCDRISQIHAASLAHDRQRGAGASSMHRAAV